MNNYEVEAAQSIEIDEDGLGLFCTIESEMNKDRRYDLRCEESATEVVVTSCTCKGFYYYKRCKHIGIAQAYWNRIYKPTPVKVEAPKEAPVKKVRKPRNGLVRKVRGGGLVKVEQKATPVAPVKLTVAEAEKAIREAEMRIEAGKIIELPVQPISSPTEDRMMKAALTTNKGFSLMR